jgi:hypothetical protein
MGTGSILVAAIWTESLPERRDSMASTLAPIEGDARFDVMWIGSRDTAEAGIADRYYRPDARHYAGLPKWRAWLLLRRNSQTTLGTSRRRSGLVAMVAAAWNIISGRGLEPDAPPSPQSDDVTRKHLLALECFESSRAAWLVVLEDDAIGQEDWPGRVLAICARLRLEEGSPSFVALSEGAGLERTSSDPIPDDLGLFEVKPPTTRTACAYLLDRPAAGEILGKLGSTGVREASGMGFDFLAAFAMTGIPVRAVWTEPPVFLHGSEQEESGLGSSIPRERR